ncbi:hypothetical protein DCMF_17765 [Candidatus Formimonas warabiya]|uniref:HAD family hydrolase n=1 Tax=Formimonas warabiya TaxID=1761012 RepID=A0A3G1L230_FORW1|nr:hypothetical protein DCMF_17765 [Candidatus Formimonas warabiya]
MKNGSPQGFHRGDQVIKTVLFDLDGTLLPVDFDVFLRRYFQAVTPYFKNMAEPAPFLKCLMFSTEEMVKNPGQYTNEEVFMTSFLPGMQQEKETVYDLFNLFYEQEFPKLKQYAGYSHLAEQIVSRVVEKGYQIALATNPVFPRMATEQRMIWAGVAHFPWALVTTYETSCGCKPHLHYFQEICAKLGVAPEECLMVGNDVQEDLVAGTMGMATFLVTDCLIDRGEPGFQADHMGSLEQLYHFVSNLPCVE